MGGVLVVSAGKVDGIITGTDLFKAFLELPGARQEATRVTATIPNQPGELAKVMKAISTNGGDFMTFGIFSGPADTNSGIITFKVDGMKKEKIKKCSETLC
jgi:hypothetical protein